MTETNEVKVESKELKEVKKQLNSVCAVVRKIKGVLEQHTGVDVDEDGKLGFVRLNVVLAMAVVCIAGAAIADNLVNYPTPSGGTGFSVDTSGNGTFGGTVTATTITGSTGFAGDLTGDDITANGTTTDTLGINLDPTVDTNVLGTITINGGRPSAAVQDNDYFTLNVYSGNDGTGGSETNTEVYASIVVTTTDVTGGTEDSKVEFKTVANGTLTEALELLADDVTVADDLTVADNIDCDLITVDAGQGIDNQAAGTLMIGASTATKVEIADTGVETEIQGTLDVLSTSDFNGAITCTNVTIDTGATVAFNGAAVTWTNSGSLTIDGSVAVTTNQTFLSATDVTNTLVIVDGIIKAIQ